MPCTPDEKAQAQRFARFYRLAREPVMLELERAVCGCDYGGSSWTTREEAHRVGALLGLAPGRRLLEVGAGSGWPGLYLGRTTGCEVALLDVPVEGPRIAVERAGAEGGAAVCRAVAADAAALPFAPGCFDAVSHSDVLCCLAAKLAVLRACRRVIRPGGTMVFTVITTAPGLSAADRDRAVRAGPPFVEARQDYPAMLRLSGFRIAERADLTAAYLASVRRLLAESEARAEAMGALFGAAEFADILTERRTTAKAIAAGLLRRELYAAKPDQVL